MNDDQLNEKAPDFLAALRAEQAARRAGEQIIETLPVYGVSKAMVEINENDSAAIVQISEIRRSLSRSGLIPGFRKQPGSSSQASALDESETSLPRTEMQLTPIALDILERAERASGKLLMSQITSRSRAHQATLQELDVAEYVTILEYRAIEGRRTISITDAGREILQASRSGRVD